MGWVLMQCNGCEKDFKDDYAWLYMDDYDRIYGMSEHNTTPFCKECVLEILEARRSILQDKYDRLSKKIDRMKSGEKR